MQTSLYNYVIKPLAQRKIRSFYQNVAKKYKHTYDFNDLVRDIEVAIMSVYQIEKTLLRREPLLSRWAGYYMANTDKWYYAYTFDGETVTIVDACHAQNLHE
jgi:hypothetical protein